MARSMTVPNWLKSRKLVVTMTGFLIVVSASFLTKKDFVSVDIYEKMVDGIVYLSGLYFGGNVTAKWATKGKGKGSSASSETE